MPAMVAADALIAYAARSAFAVVVADVVADQRGVAAAFVPHATAADVPDEIVAYHHVAHRASARGGKGDGRPAIPLAAAGLLARIVDRIAGNFQPGRNGARIDFDRLAPHAAHDVVADGEVLEAATRAVVVRARTDVDRGALVSRGLAAAVELIVDEVVVAKEARMIRNRQQIGLRGRIYPRSVHADVIRVDVQRVFRAAAHRGSKGDGEVRAAVDNDVVNEVAAFVISQRRRVALRSEAVAGPGLDHDFLAGGAGEGIVVQVEASF